MFIRGDGGVLIDGLGIGGYRSMPTIRYFAPLGKVSLLAGKNNAGKSNVIRFLERYFRDPAPRRVWEDEPRDGGEPLQMALGYRVDLERYGEFVGTDGGVRERTDQFLSLPAFHPTGDDDLIWVTYAQEREEGISGNDTSWFLSNRLVQQLKAEGSEAGLNLSTLRDGLFSTTGGDPESNIQEIVNSVFPFKDLPKIEVISAFRQVASEDAGVGRYSGGNLIATLATHQHPNAQRRHLRDKFDEINEFLKRVLEDQAVAIEIPDEKDHILVREGKQVFPLDDLGTGIHQVIILAAAATLLDDTLVCIEEPEVNLHPVLQRKLVRYLSEHTSNQYLIATHSAHMLDYERAKVIHLRKDENGTRPSRAATTQHVADICADLGYRPSDILQANAVIWVEGPSDRTYLSRWLQLLAPDFECVEGIHYTIMFYGGSLLSHITGQDPADNEELKEFISLRRLNRHSAIMIDSDRTQARGSLNPTKRRVIGEFNNSDLPGHAWVTACRTIENYIPYDILSDAVVTTHPSVIYEYEGDKWDNPLAALRGDRSGAASLHKVKIANVVTERWDETVTWPQGLKAEVRKIHQFIVDANT